MLMTLLVFAAVIAGTLGFMFVMIKVPMLISERNKKKAESNPAALKRES